MNSYLSPMNFSNRPGLPVITMVFLFAGLVSLVLAGVTIGSNAYRTTNISPSRTLSYE